MPSDPFINNITIYPVKSLDSISLHKAMVTEGGCLWHDREYAIIDEKGNFVNGKSNSLVHTLRSNMDVENEIISFRPMDESTWRQFHLQKEKGELEAYLSDYFGKKVFFKQDKTGRFMDIPDIAGVTILSTSTLKEVSTWFTNMSLEETRRRFRATLEIDGVDAFWEDHLFSHEGRGIEFTVGDVTSIGMRPRARCVVPTRDSETGEVTHAFPKSFAKHRAATLPSWSTLKEYGHHYYLTVNCYIPSTEIGKWINLGDVLRIVREKVFY
ncbi:MAG: MOSC N-terminal beta barrel domain-containing protein [Saprospiraceae bacterium]